MDYSKIKSDWVILLVVVASGILTAEAVRWYFVVNGAEAGTAWVFFFVTLILCAALYFAIIRTLYKFFGLLLNRTLLKKHGKVVDTESTPITDTAPKVDAVVDIEQIKRDADDQYLERHKAKIELFKRYTHIAVGPHVTAGELSRLDEYIERYANDEPLPDDCKPIAPTKLSNPDMFHFGWNIAHYFGKKKQDVAPWLMEVFTPLAGLELSYVVGKLHDQQTRKYIIPNIDDIPKFIAETEA